MKKLVLGIIFVLASMLPLGVNAEGLSAFGDLLVWHASQATESSWASVISIPASNVANYHDTNIKFKWNIGFRGGALYEAGPKFLDSRLYWTYFPATTTKSITTATQILAPEFFSGFLSGNIFFGGNINWKLVLNMFDYDISRQFQVGKTLSIRPAIGIKAGTINQTINCEWDAVIYSASENLINNFFGIGPSFGIDSRWNIAKNFNLIGDFAAAFMWGNWQIKDTYNGPTTLNHVFDPHMNTLTTSVHNALLGTMMFKYFMGLEWAYQGRSSVALQLGYEMQFWANQLRVPTFQQLLLHGDLTLQGGTCRIRIDL